MIDENLPKLKTTELKVTPRERAQASPPRESSRLPVPVRASVPQRTRTIPPRRRWTSRVPERVSRVGARAQEEADKRPWLRDTILKCGVSTMILLGVLILMNIDVPLARQATNAVRDAVTVDLDVGKELGKIQFVQNLLPDSMQAFWDFNGDDPNWVVPCDGEVVRTYSEGHPGVEMRGGSGNVVSVADGTVMDVKAEGDDGVRVRIQHDGGRESLYGYLKESYVTVGETVVAGEAIGLASTDEGEPRMFFESTRYTTPFDPATIITFSEAKP